MARNLATTLFLLALLFVRAPFAMASETYAPHILWELISCQEILAPHCFMLFPQESRNVAPHRSNPWHTLSMTQGAERDFVLIHPDMSVINGKMFS